MQDEQNIDAKHRFNPFPLAGWIAGLVVLYVLSVRPIVYLYHRGIISESAIDTLEDTLYAPISLLVEESEIFSQLISKYVDLWE